MGTKQSKTNSSQQMDAGANPFLDKLLQEKPALKQIPEQTIKEARTMLAEDEKEALEELRLEYDMLRREILHNDTLGLQILGATLVIAGTIMGLAFSEAVKDLSIKSLLFFVAEIVTFFGMSQAVDRIRITFLIASYLRTFTEAKMTNLKYETRLAQFRAVRPKQGYGTFGGYVIWTYTFIIVANHVLSGYYLYTSYRSTSNLIGVSLALITVIAFSALIGVRIRFNRFVEKNDQTFGPLWREIRDREGGHN